MKRRPDLDTFNLAAPFYRHGPTRQLVRFEGWARWPVSFARTELGDTEAEADIRQLEEIDDEAEYVAVFRLVDRDPTALLIATRAGYDIGERFEPVTNDDALDFRL